MKPMILAMLLILLNYTESVAQNTEKLDAVNGFNKFKFGKSISTFSNLKFQSNSIQLKGVKVYVYDGGDVKNFYGIPIDKIELSFFKGKLYQVTVSFGTIFREYRYDQYDLINSNLIANFGNYYHEVEPSLQAEILNGYIWDAREVRLEHLRIRFSEANGSRDPRFNYIQGYMLFTHKKMQQEQQNSEVE